MEAVPLIPKAKVLPNLDATPLIRELFQDEFQAVVPSKKTSQNIIKSVEYRKEGENDEILEPDQETFTSAEVFDKLTNRRENVIEFSENVLEAYKNHEKTLHEIKEAEENIFETHSHFLKREQIILQDKAIRDLLTLKRQPLFKALDTNYTRKFKLLQGEAGLPPEYQLKSDFRVENFKRWRKRLESLSQDSLIMGYLERGPPNLEKCKKSPRKSVLPGKEIIKKPQIVKKKNKIVSKIPEEIFNAEPKIVFFTDYKLGDIYIAEIKVKNIHQKGVHFQLKPTCPDGPFRVMLTERTQKTVSPGLSFYLNVEFTPKSLDNAAEDVIIMTADGNRFLIPLIAYLEPPVLKTHKEIDEFTRVTSDKILNSYIECGACFTGDTKVTKLNFRCYRGSGEFFIMSSENWSRCHINTVTVDNLLEIPPFRVYPVFFKMEKDEVIDLFVEFIPKTSGTHIENIIIACNNGQIRSLDLIGDAVGWHSYYFSFQDSLLKELPVEEDDDAKVKYYIDFEDTASNGNLEKVFCVTNNSDMAFDFQWKIREPNILLSQEKYLRLSKDQVKIDPESGTFEPNSIWEFLVTITFNNADIGKYRMVLSLYVLNLPYQCIEEDSTIIQPTGLVRNLYSQSLYGEEEALSALSPELTSLQGTYESLQESIKSYIECQSKAQAGSRIDFCKTTCIPNPGLCAKPLKKSKTYFNIGDNIEEVDGLGCACRQRPEADSNSESCHSYTRDDRVNEMSAPRNEVIWDFVDILVDEVELWVEVFPTRVTLEPSVIELNKPLNVHDKPIYRDVIIVNHNKSAVTCTWLMPCEMTKTNIRDNSATNGDTSFALIFDKKTRSRKANGSNNSVNSKQHRNKQSEQDIERKISEPEEKDTQMSGPCKITVKPQKDFRVAGLSEFICKVSIFPNKAGKIKETVRLSINEGDLKLKLLILGTVVKKTIETSPDVLDFGVLKQGTRYYKDFVIQKKNTSSLFWRINQFEFDLKNKNFLTYSDNSKDTTNLKNTEGAIAKKESSSTESYCLDARVPGIKCSLLEIEENKEKVESGGKNYILVIGDVRVPKLLLSSPRFENAILAPPGRMYVGQKVSTRVTLTNVGNVETVFTWGHPFGCHCRKIKVEISPKSCRIGRNNKMTVNIDLTALAEGIINHCYIPCFFCRSAEPLILSIVAIAETLNVTFEIIDYPMQTHADPSTFLKSPFHNTVLRVPWPVKEYNPCLGLKYINEYSILNMICHCQEADEEANRVFPAPKESQLDSEQSMDSRRSLKSFEMYEAKRSRSTILKSNTSGGSKPTEMYAAKRSRSTILKSNTSGGSKPTESVQFSNSNQSGLNTSVSCKSEENSLLTYSYVESSLESLLILKPQMEFLNVPYQTPILRQFVIRNETAIETTFQINVFTYGVSKNLPDGRIAMIKNRVFGHSTDKFQSKLAKNQPLVIVVEPSEGELKPFDAVLISVYCYGNTWGEYSDQLICQVKGIETYNLKIFAQIVGHPLYFPMFKNQTLQKPTLRFQSLSYTEGPVSKQIKVVNRSSIPFSVSWVVFLIRPVIKDEEQEDSFNLSADSNANFESHHSGEISTQSLKNYIPKNASESPSVFHNLSDTKDSGQNPESLKSVAKSLSSLSSMSVKNESTESEKSDKKIYPIFSERSELQQFVIPGRVDGRIFKVEPKEISLEPFEEVKMTVSFDPHFYKPQSFPEEFQGVLTACVKLKPEDEKSDGLYYRPCGMNYVSELMDFTALVEIPLVSFEILRGDLKFMVDANAVVKSPSKSFRIVRKFLIKNKNQKLVSLGIEVSPGLLFKVTQVNTIDKFYPQYNPESHCLKIDSGHVLELEVQCSITYKDILYAFEELKRMRKHQSCQISVDETKALSKSSTENDEEPPAKSEPWRQYADEYVKQKCTDACSLGHRDSLEINLNRMSSHSDKSLCTDNFGRHYYTEAEGEYVELPKGPEFPCAPKAPRHITVVQEEIGFIQSGLVAQTLVAEVHISFPIIKISPKSVDFGNVFLGETAVRYCSVINLTGFPTDFRVQAKINSPEFVARPLTGSLPCADYNSDIGETITVEFKPSHPGYFKEVYHVFCNSDLEFDFFELFVCGLGTWNEKYKSPKYETCMKLQGAYSNLQKMY